MKLQEGWDGAGEDRQRTRLLKNENLVLDEEKLGKLLTNLWALTWKSLNSEIMFSTKKCIYTDILLNN